MCEQFGISRFTARAAVRILSSAGLVVRRQRVGTVVVATPDDARYSHDAASLRDLLQYAQDTELRLIYIGKVALTKAQAREFGVKAGEEWIYAVGMRHEAKTNGHGDRPFCLTRLYLNPVLKGIEMRLRARKTAVYALIENEYKIPIERVEQDFQGVVLDADDAANLGARRARPRFASCVATTATTAGCSNWPTTYIRATGSRTRCSCASSVTALRLYRKTRFKSPIDIRFGSIYIVRTNRHRRHG